MTVRHACKAAADPEKYCRVQGNRHNRHREPAFQDEDMRDADTALFYAATHGRNLMHVEHALMHQKLLKFTPGTPPYYIVIDKKVKDGYYRSNAQRPYTKETAAHVAGMQGDKPILEFLLRKGWLPMAEDANGMTVRDWAQAGGHHILAEWVDLMERNRLQKLQLAKMKRDSALAADKRKKTELLSRNQSRENRGTRRRW
jgi:hypothetical protein